MTDRQAAVAHAQEVFAGEPSSQRLDKSRRAAVQAFMYGVQWQLDATGAVVRMRDLRIKWQAKEIAGLKAGLKMEREARI